MRKTALLASLAAAALLAASAQAVTIDWVHVGSPGNAGDVQSQGTFGAVGHFYRIGKYEITAGQYTEFLNAVAAADPNGLYNANMTSTFGANIVRAGASGSFSYSVAADWADRPVNFVSIWDAARFVNWLHNDQPTGPQGPGTTEDGAYVNIGNQTTFAREPGAKYWIPTENEWYKAAYYDPHHGGPGVGGYWDYPTGTDAVPGRDLMEATNPGNNANYYDNGFLIGSPYYRTEVGGFELSASPYGTFDQGGNVWEWNETNDSVWGLGVRGGSFIESSLELRASIRLDGIPGAEGSFIGFRVASIPEPGSAALCLAGVTALLVWRRRR